MSNDYDFSNVNQGRAGNVYDFKGVEVSLTNSSKNPHLPHTTAIYNPEPSRSPQEAVCQGLQAERDFRQR